MDELAKRFFHDPAVYARAAELLSRYEAVENLNWESVEDYLAGLDEGETELLDTALSHRKAVQLQQSHQSLLEKVALLEKTVEALTKSPPSALHNNSIQNKMDAGEVAGGIAPSSSEPFLITPQRPGVHPLRLQAFPFRNGMKTISFWWRWGRSFWITSADRSRRVP